MFGYLSVSAETLDQKLYDRYKACYCGLCRALGDRYGLAARLTLTYDMTFLVLLLNSLYEPDETNGEDRCIRHPNEAQKWWKSSITNYAVDMNIALAYYKCLDNWNDDSSALSFAEAAALKKAFNKVALSYPRQCGIIHSSLVRLSDIEKRQAFDPDEASDCFGELMAEVFVLYDDRWQSALRSIGMHLGKAIYLMDAALDLDKDTLFGRYNPFRKYYGCDDNAKRFGDIIRMILGDCLYSFDYLPLIKDADLMKNILCIGIWTEFRKKYNEPEETV